MASEVILILSLSGNVGFCLQISTLSPSQAISQVKTCQKCCRKLLVFCSSIISTYSGCLDWVTQKVIKQIINLRSSLFTPQSPNSGDLIMGKRQILSKVCCPWQYWQNYEELSYSWWCKCLGPKSTEWPATTGNSHLPLVSRLQWLSKVPQLPGIRFLGVHHQHLFVLLQPIHNASGTLWNGLGW